MAEACTVKGIPMDSITIGVVKCDACPGEHFCLPEIATHEQVWAAVQGRGAAGGETTSPASQLHATWTGQVVSIRPLHRTLFFATIRPEGTPTGCSVEFMVQKPNLSPDTSEVTLRLLQYELRPGDIVTGHGCLEYSHFLAKKMAVHGRHEWMLAVQRLELLRRWRDVHGIEQYNPFLGHPSSPVTTSSVSHLETYSINSVDCIPLPSPLATVAGSLETIEPRGAHAGGGVDVDSSRTIIVRVERLWHGLPLHRLCKHIFQPSGCQRLTCPLLHHWRELAEASSDVSPLALQQAWQQWRADNRALGTLRLEGDGFHVDEKVKHASRAHAFVSWLRAHVEPAVLRRGVVDVAGGRGEVSHLLTQQVGVPCTVIDPRPQNFRKCHLRVYAKTPGTPPPTYIQDYFNPSFASAAGNVEWLTRTGLIIGFHPDEATEAIVDTALALNKPFVVVPCCVFSKDFPGRRTRDGGEVTSYAHFVQYLKEKGAGAATGGVGCKTEIQLTFLPYSGANAILYRLPAYDTTPVTTDSGILQHDPLPHKGSAVSSEVCD